MGTKRQIIEGQKNPYRRASKKEKSRILQGLVTTTGLIRDRESGEFARILDNLLRYKIEKELSRCQLKEEDNTMMNSNVGQSA